MADFPQHEAPERKKPLSGRKNGVQRETYRKAKQADRHIAKQRLNHDAKRGNTDDQ
ncbi:hypothetical protein [Paracoccus sp. (in: a-proteobacteria)]|uniref:hypothetical protein n=1 Tax=Paracoccus sp. TaxID=267 RepID=UPI002AFECC90|nr:hypothetical protein [Paracoccus sp. (in: a-proteobacteria)]